MKPNFTTAFLVNCDHGIGDLKSTISMKESLESNNRLLKEV